MEEKVLVEAKKVSRVFPVPGGEFTALKGIDLKVAQGSLTILKGRSGSGKTTLMNLIGMLDDPTSGEILWEGRSVRELSDRERENLRRCRMGFVFQAVSLLPAMNALQNVEFSMRLAGIGNAAERQRRAQECLKMVGLGNRMTHMPAEMSGGEQQRVAIARAIAHRPGLVLADEPTAELDSRLAAQVVKLFLDMTRREGISVLMTTHDAGLMDAADHVIELENGQQLSKAAQPG